MAAQPSSSAVRALALEYKTIQEEPVEGFRIKLTNDDILFDWEVAIFGPPETLYQGGYFKVISCFKNTLDLLSQCFLFFRSGSAQVSTWLSLLASLYEICDQSLASECLWGGFHFFH